MVMWTCVSGILAFAIPSAFACLAISVAAIGSIVAYFVNRLGPEKLGRILVSCR